MARVLSGSDDEMLVRMYGSPTRDTVDFLRDRIDRLADRFGQSFGHMHERLINRLENTAGRMLRIAQNTVDMVGNLFNDRIQVMTDLTAFRTASHLNQEYMLSHPVFERMHHAGRIEGWGRTPNEQLRREDNPYYQSVVDGMMVYSDESLDGEEVNDGYDQFVTYSSEELDGVQELQIGAKTTIMNNWRRLYELTEAHSEDDSGVEDPTSIHGGYL